MLWKPGNRLAILWVVVLILVAATLPAAQRRTPLFYALTDLGTLGGLSSEATAINLLGEVVGAAATPAGQWHAFVYRNGRMLDLGTLPGGTASRATGITRAGVVVGYGGINRYGPGFREFTQGFVWREGAMASIGALYCPCTYNRRYGTSRALAVSDAGLIVGESETFRAGLTHAFLWQTNAMRDLGVEIDALVPSAAYGINDRHEVVGAVNGRAFVVTAGDRRDLGVLSGYVSSTARAISNTGIAVGESISVAGAARAVLWDRGLIRDLGTLPGDAASAALAVNVFGHAVGRSGTIDFARSRAVLWRDGAVIDLNAFVAARGWILTSATGINDTGQIVGDGLFNGQIRAFRLDPM